MALKTLHSTGVAAVSLLFAAGSVLCIDLGSSLIIGVLAIAVAIVGVPHGGLDHWTGRNLLHDRFPRVWAPIFFGGYCVVAAAVLFSWMFSPVLAATAFFLLSAWHFGVEDRIDARRLTIRGHLSAIAIGGMVIWVPSLFQSESFFRVVQTIIFSDFGEAASKVLQLTQMIAIVAIAIAIADTSRDLACKRNLQSVGRNICFGILFAAVDVLISFGVYFCGWHSVRGLQRMAREHDKSFKQLIWSALPLSAAAIVLAGLGMWIWSSGQGMPEAVSRTLFLSLSAIAVPHLLLHGPIVNRLGSALQREPGSNDPGRLKVST